MNNDPWPGSPSKVLAREIAARADRVADMLARTSDAHPPVWPGLRCAGCDWTAADDGGEEGTLEQFRIHVAMAQANALARFGFIA